MIGKRAVLNAACVTRRKLSTAAASQHLFTPQWYQAVNRPSCIMFGCNSECVAVEKLLAQQLNNNGGIRALVICGGGDNCLSLLADPSIQSVASVDVNAHQLALSQLKLAVACSHLSTQEALGFMGMNDCLGDRLEVFHDVLKPLLPHHVSTLIETDLHREVATGVAHFGIGENCYRHLRLKLEEMGFPAHEVWKGNVNLDAFREACQNGIGTAQEMADASLITAVPNMPPNISQFYIDAIHENLFEHACMGLYRMVADGSCKNHLVAMQILNYYDESSLPEWLIPENRQALRDKHSNLHYIHSPLLEVPCSGDDDEKYHLVACSNIFDWFSPQDAARDLESIGAKYLALDGYLLVRMGIKSLEDVLNQLTTLQQCPTITPKQLAQEDKVQVLFQRDESLAALRHLS